MSSNSNDKKNTDNTTNQMKQSGHRSRSVQNISNNMLGLMSLERVVPCKGNEIWANKNLWVATNVIHNNHHSAPHSKSTIRHTGQASHTSTAPFAIITSHTCDNYKVQTRPDQSLKPQPPERPKENKVQSLVNTCYHRRLTFERIWKKLLMDILK